MGHVKGERDEPRTSFLASLQAGLAVMSLAVGLAVAACYLARWPGVVAVTVFPPWAWFPIGFLLLVLSHSARRRRRGVVVLGTWVLVLLLLAEEPWAPLTGLRRSTDPAWQRARAGNVALRVVTANCCGGNAEVVREALRYRPDLLLLQECPGTRETLDVLAEQPGYELVPGIDVSMAVRGSARGIPVERHHRGFIAAAEARVANRTVRVVNTHLVLPYHDLDLWDPHAWTAARQAQEARAEQMAAVWRYAEATPADLPLIVGGDFNAPAGDGLFRALKPRLRDSFRDAGRGLGNTITNEYPISRIDQVWVSRDLRVHTVLARRTRHSDHRLVVADVSFR